MTAILSLAKDLNTGLAFLLELAVYASVCWWGFTASRRPAVRLLLAIGGLAVFITLWALFGAPSATYELHGGVRIAFEVVWYGLGALALARAWRVAPAVVFAALVVLSETLARVWHQN